LRTLALAKGKAFEIYLLFSIKLIMSGNKTGFSSKLAGKEEGPSLFPNYLCTSVGFRVRLEEKCIFKLLISVSFFNFNFKCYALDYSSVSSTVKS
jgi:hypothetical protein